MSNTEGSAARSAARHRPAIWAIAIALLAAVIAFLVFAPWRGPETTPAGEVTPPAATAPTTTAPPATGPADPAPATPQTGG